MTNVNEVAGASKYVYQVSFTPNILRVLYLQCGIARKLRTHGVID